MKDDSSLAPRIDDANNDHCLHANCAARRIWPQENDSATRSLALGVSVSDPTPVVSVTLCDANDRSEFDGLSRQKPEMKEDLHHF